MTIQKQLITFIMVGCMNTVFGYSMYALFIFLGLNYQTAMLCSMCIGVLFNFQTTGKLVFSKDNNKAFFKFVAVYAFMYFFNISFIRFVKLFTSNLYLAGFITIIPAAALTFTLNKFMVFRKPRIILPVREENPS